jgi:hypothetical protein
MQARDVTRPTSAPVPAAPTAVLPPPAASVSQPAPATPASAPPPALSQINRPPVADIGREGWSLGDLLARASRDEEHAAASASRPSPPPQLPAAPPPPQTPQPAPFRFDIDVVARALDQPTTSALWSRLGAGHRNVLSRGLYSAEGRQIFDEITRRLPTDPGLQATLARFLEDFERIRRELDQRDPSGRSTQSHLLSDSGRVYLFLAHATGRLT